MRGQKLKQSVLFIAVWAFVAVFAVQAQTGAAFREYKLKSKLMAREMPYRLIVPDGYEADANKSKRYAVVYLLHGLSGHYDNWTSRTKLAEYALKYQYIIVTPEGDNGWYTDS